MHQPHFVSRRAFGVLAAVATLALLIAPATFTTPPVQAQDTQTLFTEDFETPGDGTRYTLTDGNGTVINEYSDLEPTNDPNDADGFTGGADYVTRVDGSQLGTGGAGIDLGYLFSQWKSAGLMGKVVL